MMRVIGWCLAAWVAVSPVVADPLTFYAPAPNGDVLIIYSTLDARLAAPLVMAFQAANPGPNVIYEDLLSGEIAERVRQETDAGLATADFVFSSAMDVQVKLANDGYAQRVTVAESTNWPRWANWRDMAYAMTYEPGVLIYHKPSFPDGPPTSRQALMQWLQGDGLRQPGRIGTYDIERSAVGYLFLARDAEHLPKSGRWSAQWGRRGCSAFPPASRS